MSLMDNVKQLDTKQKGMLVAVIGCLGLVFYLAYTTFFSGGDSGPAPTASIETTPAPPQVVTEATPAPNADTNNNEITQNTAISPPMVDASNRDQTSTPPSPANLALLAQSQQMQQQYIQLVNQYQLAQLQQKLAAVDAQIAASKLTTTKSLVELKKLQPLLGSQYATNTGNGGDSNASNGPAQPATFQTMYVGQVSGKWQAMLQLDGQYFQVGTGMRLPDGSVVSQINARGVVIMTTSGTPVFLPMTKSLD